MNFIEILLQRINQNLFFDSIQVISKFDLIDINGIGIFEIDLVIHC